MLRYYEPVRRVDEGILRIYLRVDLRQPSILTGMRALGHIRQFATSKNLLSFPPLIYSTSAIGGNE